MSEENLAGWTADQRANVEKVLDWRLGFEDCCGGPASVRQFKELSSFQVNLGKLKKNNQAHGLLTELKQNLIPDAESALTDEYFAPHRRTLLEALDRFEKLYRERKRAAVALDFADLAENAVRLLEENPEVRERVRGQFDYILMDEFQDTNGLQSRLLDLVRPADRFYAVGDVNQSIYGFRHADPEVFTGYRSSVESSGRHVAELRENWRSRADILTAVSGLLNRSPGIEPHTFRPVRAFDEKQVPSVEMISCMGDDSRLASALEAEWVAARIRELHGTLRLQKGAARFGDMAVLLRKIDSFEPLADAFERAGIPYIVTAGRGFYDQPEVADLMHLLRVIANPRDEISLATVLRSPLCGASDEALLQLRLIDRMNIGAALSNLDSADPTLAPVRRFAGDLTSWRELRHEVSPDRLLIRAMDAAGYEQKQTARARSNIAKLLALVSDFGERLSIDELVEELERVRESDPKEQDSMAEDAGDVVRVLTVHSAKGLEFPIVFLPALQALPNRSGGILMFSQRHGLGVRWRNPVTGDPAKDSLYLRAAKEWKTKEDAEANRLLYVAMTRAEEHLVLSCASAKNKPGEWAGLIAKEWNLELRTTVDAHVRDVPVQGGQSFALRMVCTEAQPPAVGRLDIAAVEHRHVQIELPQTGDQHDSIASVTSIALFADCPRKYYLSRYLGWEGRRGRLRVDEEEDDVESDRDSMDATEFGTEVHRLLAGSPREGAGDEALSLVRGFETSPLGMRVAGAARVEREFDFLLAIDDVVLRGQIDLWFEDAEGQVIIDYKTD
ncbi:MAG: 3'-5' exonuclease, partial [Bryobacteraceae bacterium]